MTEPIEERRQPTRRLSHHDIIRVLREYADPMTAQEIAEILEVEEHERVTGILTHWVKKYPEAGITRVGHGRYTFRVPPRRRKRVDPEQLTLPDAPTFEEREEAPVTGPTGEPIIQRDLPPEPAGREQAIITNKLQRIERHLSDAIRELSGLTREFAVAREKARRYDKLSLEFRGYSSNDLR